MDQQLVFILCLISLLLSVISIYISLKVAKNLGIANKNIETIHQALLAILQPGAYGDQYIIHYVDENGYPYHEEDLPRSNHGPEDTVVDFYSRQALEWNEELNDWVPKAPQDQEDN